MNTTSPADPVTSFYTKGYEDAKDPARKRMRAVTQNYRLAYVSGWWDSRRGRPHRA